MKDLEPIKVGMKLVNIKVFRMPLQKGKPHAVKFVAAIGSETREHVHTFDPAKNNRTSESIDQEIRDAANWFAEHVVTGHVRTGSALDEYFSGK